MTGAPVFTVFTPTYNRANLIGGVYASLQSQTFRSFEWLIVDDGSEDGTAQLVQNWQAVSDFTIRYFWQPNGGKHRAFNRGVQEAHGELFLTLDSDDSCLPESLERFKFHWDAIPSDNRGLFSAVTALCADAQGCVVGDRIPQEVLDSDSISLQHRYRINGEKWGFHRTEVLRQFPYPEFAGEKFVPESLVWNRIARHYRTRYVNEALRIYETGRDSLSRRSVRLRIENLQGSLLYYRELQNFQLPVRARFKAAANYVRFSLHGRKSLYDILIESGVPAWVIAVFPVGVFCFWRDKHQMRSDS